MDCLVSIALATYNGEKYLETFLESVYRQSYPNIELVVVDDCSSDNTLDILEKYEKTNGLRLYKNETNIGFVKNFEKALRYCKGKFIALADQDDIWFPEKIEILVSKIGDNLLIHSDAILIDSKNQQIANSFTLFSKKRVSINSFKRLLFYNHVTGCTSMINNTLLDFALPFPEKILYHDWWLALVAARHCGLKYIPDRLLQYRQHQNVSGGAEKMLLNKLISNSLYKGFFTDRYEKNLKMLHWYQSIQQSNIAETNKEKTLIETMIDYHKSFFEKRIRLKAFFIHLRYFAYLYPHYRFYTRILILFTSLIGLGRKFKGPL